MAKVADFASAKRKAAKDNLEWTAKDMLLEALEDYEAGRWTPHSAIIIGCTQHENGSPKTFSTYRAGCTRERELTMLVQTQKTHLDNW